MSDPREIKELEEKLLLDEQRYAEIERLEGELLGHIPHEGFQAAALGVQYRVEKEELENSMRIEREMLVAMRSQPD